MTPVLSLPATRTSPGLTLSMAMVFSAAAHLCTTGAHAADFYQGKHITITVGFTGGGTYNWLYATPPEVVDLVRKINAAH